MVKVVLPEASKVIVWFAPALIVYVTTAPAGPLNDIVVVEPEQMDVVVQFVLPYVY